MNYTTIVTDINQLVKENQTRYKIQEDWEKDPSNLDLIFLGPENTPYENGLFKVSLNFSIHYPFKPPKVRFLTKVFHPEIDENGNICSNCFLYNWSTKGILSGLMEKIMMILKSPSTNCYISGEASDLFIEDRQFFYQKARDWTENYAR